MKTTNRSKYKQFCDSERIPTTPQKTKNKKTYHLLGCKLLLLGMELLLLHTHAACQVHLLLGDDEPSLGVLRYKERRKGEKC